MNLLIRVSPDVPAALRAITAIDPHARMSGADLPSTRAPRPFVPSDIAPLLDALGEQDGRRALYDNAIALYRPGASVAPVHKS